MKRSSLLSILFTMLMLFTVCACTSNVSLTSVHPSIAQSGESASVMLSLPADMKIESAGETAKLYELTMDEAAAISQIEKCLGMRLSTLEKQTDELGTRYKTDKYVIDIDSESGYWFFSVIDYPPAKAGLSISDEKAIEIAKSFVEEKELWPDGVDNIQIADQYDLNENGDYGISMKTVYMYPQIEGKTVLGVYRISVDVSLEGEILSVYYLVNPIGNSSEAALKSRAEVAANVQNEDYSASFTSNLTNAKINDCELGYYADGVEHNGKTYLFPVYIMTGEGTNANGEKETFDIIIDALK